MANPKDARIGKEHEDLSAKAARERAMKILFEAEELICDAPNACRVMREFVDSDEVTTDHNREAAVWMAIDMFRRAVKTREMFFSLWDVLADKERQDSSTK